MKFQVTHTTVYKASQRVSVCHNAAWLTPRTTANQQVESHEISIVPAPSIRAIRTDVFGNQVTHFSFNEGYDELRVAARSIVTVAAIERRHASDEWESVRSQLTNHSSPVELDAVQFRFNSPRCHASEDAAAYAEASFTPRRPIVEALADLTSRIHDDFEYDPKATTVSTPIDEVLQQKRGVCQDFAHVQIAMLRSLGLAARYVSGYVRTIPAPGRPRLVGADASHAWIAAYCGSLGWIDVDPTNNGFVSDQHIVAAWGRDYGDVTPLKGVYTGGGKHWLDISVDVVPVERPPCGEALRQV